MENSLKTVVSTLEDLFVKFNDKYYNGELQTPVICVHPDSTASTFGWCTMWKAWHRTPVDGETVDTEEGFYEINVCAEYLNRPFEDVCETLLHEMVHLWCLQNQIKDTSRGNAYHNKKYKEEAEKHGLFADHHPTYGWTITKLNEEARVMVSELDNKCFQLHRTKEVKMKKGGSKQSSRKYVCPECGIIVRATKVVNIICGDCQCELEEEE